MLLGVPRVRFSIEGERQKGIVFAEVSSEDGERVALGRNALGADRMLLSPCVEDFHYLMVQLIPKGEVIVITDKRKPEVCCARVVVVLVFHWRELVLRSRLACRNPEKLAKRMPPCFCKQIEAVSTLATPTMPSDRSVNLALGTRTCGSSGATSTLMTARAWMCPHGPSVVATTRASRHWKSLRTSSTS
jgi:hypothetical protein